MNPINPVIKRSIMIAVDKKYPTCKKLIAYLDKQCMEAQYANDISKIEPLENNGSFYKVMILFNLKSLYKVTIDIAKNIIILHGDKEIVL